MKISFDNKVVNIKKATWEDVHYCYNLMTRNMSKYKTGEKSFKKYKEEFIPSDTHIVQYRGRRFGFIEFQKKPDGWYVWDIQLSKILQGKGLGTKLMEYVESIVKKNGGRKLFLYVYTKNPAQELYKKLGFVVVETFKKPSRVKMLKNIKAKS